MNADGSDTGIRKMYVEQLTPGKIDFRNIKISDEFRKQIKADRVILDTDKTQKEIAKILGLQQTHYSRYERGERELPMHLFIELAKFYNISLDYLTGIMDTPRPLFYEDRQKETTITAQEMNIIKKYRENSGFKAAIDAILKI